MREYATNAHGKKITVSRFTLPLLMWAFIFCLASPARSGDQLTSTLELMDAVAAVDGIRIVDATDVVPSVYTEDYGPAQVVEIFRPDMRPIAVGRLGTTCSCIQATMEKKYFAQGERALVEIRNVKPSQPEGAQYGVFVMLESPYRMALQHIVFVKSDRKPGDAAPVPATAAQPAEESHNPADRIQYDAIKEYAPKAKTE